jgi:hypothetical protein
MEGDLLFQDAPPEENHLQNSAATCHTAYKRLKRVLCEIEVKHFK